MFGLYVTSPYAGAGKTMLCAGLGRHFLEEGKRIGFFKPLIGEIKSAEAPDSDAQFMKQVLSLKEPVESLCPIIDGLADVRGKLREAYTKLSRGKDVVVIEGVWRQRPGTKPIEASYQVVEALGARVIIIEPYSGSLSSALALYRGFGDYLLGVVVNRVPRGRLKDIPAGLSGVNILGVIPEDRTLFSLTVKELAEHINGEILNSADRSSELVESLMLGAMVVDSGLDYFGRKNNKAVVVRGDRPDMQLAALETSTSCLVITGGVSPIHTVLRRAKDKGIPIILTKDDTNAVVSGIEQALGRGRFSQERKLSRLAEILAEHFDFQALAKGGI